MRVKTVILLECAVIGLVAVGQRVAFAAEPVVVKLRLSTSLSAGIAGRNGTGQVAASPSVWASDPAVVALQLSAWGAAPTSNNGGGGSGGDPLRMMDRVTLPERRRGDDAAETALAEATTASDVNGSYGNGGKSWQLAPIRWGGDVQELLRYVSTDNDGEKSSSLSNMQLFNLRAASYLWQPWFAGVSGDISLLRDSTTGDTDTTSTSVHGGGSITVFPVSRFPFTAAFSSTNSQTDSKQFSEKTTGRRYSLQQSYRPLTGNASYIGSYVRDTLTTDTRGDDTVEKWEGSYTNLFDTQSVSFIANRTETSRNGPTFGEGMTYDSLMAQHRYFPSANLTVDSNASLIDMNLLTDSGAPTVTQNKLRYLQAYSNASWRPKEDLPLTLTGSAQYYDFKSDYGDQSSDSQSLMGNVGATYQPTVNLSLSANAMLTHISSSGESSRISSSQSGSATYSGDPIAFGDFNYGWSASTSFSNNMGDSIESSQQAMASASHSLSRTYELSPIMSMGASASQSVSTRWDSIIGNNSTLTTSGMLSWRVTPSESMTGSVNLSATDTRTVGTEESEYQFVNLNTEGRIQLSAYSSASANFSVQMNRTGNRTWETVSGGIRTVDSAEAQTTINTVGTASYQHMRAFNVRNLRYSALASMNMQQTDSRLRGDQNASVDPVEYMLEQHLDYDIGRLNVRLTGTATVRDGQETTFIYLQVGRTFGAY